MKFELHNLIEPSGAVVSRIKKTGDVDLPALREALEYEQHRRAPREAVVEALRIRIAQLAPYENGGCDLTKLESAPI